MLPSQKLTKAFSPLFPQYLSDVCSSNMNLPSPDESNSQQYCTYSRGDNV